MTHSENSISVIISHHFGLHEEYRSLEDLHSALSSAVCEMLLRDYQKLLNLLYRLDVSEQKFQQAFKEGSSNLISGKISALIIERELEKSKWREKFK